MDSKRIRNSKGIKQETARDLRMIERLDQCYAKSKNKHQRHQICLMENNYRSVVLFYVQAQDYPVAYSTGRLNLRILKMWLRFLTMNAIQLHLSLLANKHLSSTDKIIGETIDTFVGFCYLNFKNIKIFDVNLNMISLTTGIPLNQVQKSVRRLGKYAGYFDHSTHSKDDI